MLNIEDLKEENRQLKLSLSLAEAVAKSKNLYDLKKVGKLAIEKNEDIKQLKKDYDKLANFVGVGDTARVRIKSYTDLREDLRKAEGTHRAYSDMQRTTIANLTKELNEYIVEKRILCVALGCSQDPTIKEIHDMRDIQNGRVETIKKLKKELELCNTMKEKHAKTLWEYYDKIESLEKEIADNKYMCDKDHENMRLEAKREVFKELETEMGDNYDYVDGKKIRKMKEKHLKMR